MARPREGIVFAFFGDGAMGEGAIHESLNLASLWDLRLLFVCESNAAADTSRTQANSMQAARSLTELAEVHQIASSAADAGDPRAIGEALRAAAGAVRSGGGPQFVEARSQPWPGNAAFLPRLVDGELDLSATGGAAPPGGWSAADPIVREARALLSEGVALEAILELDRSIRDGVLEAFVRAEQAPPAPETIALAGVWSTP